jgi:hypothetical protein
VSVHRWWSTPLSPPSALASLRARLPATLRLTGRGIGTVTGGATLTYLILEGPPIRGSNDETLLVTIAGDRRGSGIRADAQVLWVPPRTAAEDVSPGVRHVTLLEYRRDSSHVLARVTLSGARARRLARLVNDLPVDNRGPHGCTLDTGLRIRMTFPTDGGGLVFTVWPACGSVLVSAGGSSQPALLMRTALSDALARDLGLNATH